MKKDVLQYFDQRFGISASAFKDFEFYLGSKGRIFLGPKNTINKPEPVSIGLLAARVGNSIKPSTNILQLFGKYATKNIIALTKEQTVKYAKGEDIRFTSKELGDISDGYVILSYHDTPLGCGFLKENLVTNMLPKAKRIELKFL